MNTSSSSLRALRFPAVGAFVATLGLLALPSLAHAELLNSWEHNHGGTAAVVSGLNTASPTLGNGSTNSASPSAQTLHAATQSSYFLSAVGDSITLSGGVTFQNSAAPEADQFRFGLYDSNGQSGRTGWLGYFVTNSGAPTGGTGPTAGRLWERNDPNTGSFGSGTGATQVTSGVSISVSPSNTSFGSGDYIFSLSYTRTETGLDIAWSIIGTGESNYSLAGSYSDATPETYTFNRAGFFIGDKLNANQVSFSNIDVTYAAVIPEPASVALLLATAAGLLTVVSRRRAASRAA